MPEHAEHRDAYRELIESKRRAHEAAGFEAKALGAHLFAHQTPIVRWALRLGRAAIFADTGLGKTAMQLEWAAQVADHTGGKVLILAPLAVREQTIAEAARFGVAAGEVTSSSRVHVLNYHRLHQIDPGAYAGVVLDESSILKSFDGRTRTQLIEAFGRTPYRLACTATPAPNDYTELGNHAEFLGVCSRTEMLAEFFVHDMETTQEWRLKGHAVGDFWRWVASWAVLVRKPADLGIEDVRYDLPPLHLRERVVPVGADFARNQGTLFVVDAQTLTDQRTARRATVESRCAAVAEEVNASPDPWLVWCELNDEADAVTAAIPGAINVQGSDDPDTKAERLLGFARGHFRVLVTKPSIGGFGMNWQHCHRMAFVGVGHSYEAWYQAVRRCWRFGQAHPVDVLMVRSDADGAIAQNLRRKAEAADAMASEMLSMVAETQLAALMSRRPGTTDRPMQPLQLPSWLRGVA